jgi:hypothetical protein
VKQFLFQLVLLAGIVLVVAASFFNLFFSIALFAVFFAASLAFAYSFEKSERRAGFVFAAFFFVVSALFVSYRLAASAASSYLFYPVSYIILLAVLLALVPLFKKLVLGKTMSCRVVGYSNGYAMVEVKKSFPHGLRKGVYAVSSKPVKKGDVVSVHLRNRFFGEPLLLRAEKE